MSPTIDEIAVTVVYMLESDASSDEIRAFLQKAYPNADHQAIMQRAADINFKMELASRDQFPPDSNNKQ